MQMETDAASEVRGRGFKQVGICREVGNLVGRLFFISHYMYNSLQLRFMYRYKYPKTHMPFAFIHNHVFMIRLILI